MDQTELKPPTDDDVQADEESAKRSRQDPRMLSQVGPSSVPTTQTVITTGLVAQDEADHDGGAGDSDSDMEDLTEDERQRRDLDRRASFRRIYDELKDGDGKPNPDGIRTIVTTNAAAVAAANAIGGVANFQTTAVPATAVTSMIHDPASGVQFQVVTNSPVATVGGAAAQPSVITFNSPQVRVSGVTANPAAAAQFVTSGQLQRVPASLGTLPTQGVVIQAPNQQQLAEDSTRKRELRLMKNREAAKECRRKKKEYVKCLENRVAVLEAQNKTLIEELKALKDLYCHKSADNS